MISRVVALALVALTACGDSGPKSSVGQVYPQSVELPEMIGSQTYRATILFPAAAKLESSPGVPPIYDMAGGEIWLRWRDHRLANACVEQTNVVASTVTDRRRETLRDGTMESCNIGKTFAVVRSIRIGDDVLYCFVAGRWKTETPPADRILGEAICRSMFIEWDHDGDLTLPSRFKGCTATLSFGKNTQGEPAWIQHETCPPDHPYKR